MTAIFALLLATAFPSTSQTSWMRPESFHLFIGMRRAVVLETLKDFGWKAEKDKRGDLFVDYTDERSFTLHFDHDRLHSIRFELYTIVGQARQAFDEQRSFLHATFGKPKKASKKIVFYNNRLPNVMMVLNDDPKSDIGKKGVGLLVVRYYDPR